MKNVSIGLLFSLCLLIFSLVFVDCCVLMRNATIGFIEGKLNLSSFAMVVCIGALISWLHVRHARGGLNAFCGAV